MRAPTQRNALALTCIGALMLAGAPADAGPNSRTCRTGYSHGYLKGSSYGYRAKPCYSRGSSYRYGYISSGGRYCGPRSGSSFSFGYYGGSYGSGYSVGFSSGYNSCAPRYSYRRSYYKPYCPPTTVVNSYPTERVVYVNNPVQDRVVYVNSTPPVAQQPTQRIASDTPAPPPAPAADGWDLLAINDANGALVAFARECDTSPNASLPKIGFALTSAMLSRDGDAVWAMRRALRTNPEGIMYFPRNPAFAPALTDLAEHYRAQANADPSNTDAQFMLAAVSFLRDDLYTARMAANSAVHYGDTDASVYNLKTAIDQDSR